VIAWIVWQYLHDTLQAMTGLHWTSPAGLLSGIGTLALGVAGRIAVGLAVIAGADLIWQRWNYKRQLRMTRQEVKEERRQYETPPEVRSRQRARQIVMARRRALKAVPTADVVIANPAHVAVALKYDQRSMDAPVVVAKGADFLCQTIKDIAARHGIPIVERPELARALYATVREGQAVGEALYVAVAEVLAMIYRLRKARK
jgi:flagellar biosynthetic protein FlhB